MYVRMSVAILFLTFLVANTIFALVPYTNASSKSPYESGYDHGCDDADISDPDNRYINQPEKGPSFHTNEFMRGYNDGYDDCQNEAFILTNSCVDIMMAMMTVKMKMKMLIYPYMMAA